MIASRHRSAKSPSHAANGSHANRIRWTDVIATGEGAWIVTSLLERTQPDVQYQRPAIATKAQALHDFSDRHHTDSVNHARVSFVGVATNHFTAKMVTPKTARLQTFQPITTPTTRLNRTLPTTKTDMNTAATATDLPTYCTQTAKNAKKASAQLATLDTAIKNRWLNESADALVGAVDRIVAANAKDLEAAPGYGLSDAAIDRLRLDQTRIEAIASALREIAMLPDPVGEVLDGFTRPGGLQIIKKRVPLGVVFFIYESRPNVTADAAAICVKSGNAVILRGGKEAIHSSQAIVELMCETAEQCGLPQHAVQLVNTTDRAAVGEFLSLGELIDVAIPRGGEGLIRRVAAEATMPVIKHYDGNCHVYVDETADLEMAAKIIENAKCQRMGVCNACESLVIHQAVAAKSLPLIAEKLAQHSVEIRADERAQKHLTDCKPATEEDWGTEYLGPTISVAVVDSIDEAIEHINRYSSHHTEAIVTNTLAAAEKFTGGIDSSAVMVNASTRFNDGGVFGLGAEIGISTDKFHARGPCGLRELTTYKYIVKGDGHIRT